MSAGIVRMHAFDASLTYARGNSAHGELVAEADAVRWCSRTPTSTPLRSPPSYCYRARSASWLRVPTSS